MTDPTGATTTSKRPVASGCAVVVVTLIGLCALTALAVVLALWRRPGDPVRFEVQLDGAPVPTTARVEASYEPWADIPFLTRDIFGHAPTTRLAESASLRGGWLSVELEDGWRSIRDERLHYVSFNTGGLGVSFGAIDDPEPFGPPQLRAHGPTNPTEWAERHGGVATFRGHARFVPSTINYDRRVHTVRAIIDVHPIQAAQLSPDNTVDARPGVAAQARVTVARTGSGWLRADLASTPVRDPTVQAVIVRHEDLLSALGWRNAGLPVTPAEWRTLAAHHDARFALTVEPTATGAILRFTPPLDFGADPQWHVVAVAFGPGEELASAAEAYLWFGDGA